MLALPPVRRLRPWTQTDTGLMVRGPWPVGLLIEARSLAPLSLCCGDWLAQAEEATCQTCGFAVGGATGLPRTAHGPEAEAALLEALVSPSCSDVLAAVLAADEYAVEVEALRLAFELSPWDTAVATELGRAVGAVLLTLPFE